MRSVRQPARAVGPPAEGSQATRSTLEKTRRARTRPRPTQFDYLHLRALLHDLRSGFARMPAAPDVLDVFCGTRPYDHLLPPGSRIVGLDVDDRWGTADVVTDEFLPFPDASFDAVLCIQAFYFLPDGAHALSEMWRVLRPGGLVIITLPFVWEFDRSDVRRRYTRRELTDLFARWEEVEIVDSGGYAVSWTMLNGWIVNAVQQHVPRRISLPAILRPLFASLYLMINGFGGALDAAERRVTSPPYTLPMSLVITARRTSGAE